MPKYATVSRRGEEEKKKQQQMNKKTMGAIKNEGVPIEKGTIEKGMFTLRFG